MLLFILAALAATPAAARQPPFDDWQAAVSGDNPLLCPLDSSPTILGVLPNPFTRATTIRYQVLDAGPVSLKILDVTGRCVREVKTDSRRSGIYAGPWDGLDDHNRALPNGVYFCQLESNGSRSTAKVCLTR